jgi:hypothetical protein
MTTQRPFGLSCGRLANLPVGNLWQKRKPTLACQGRHPAIVPELSSDGIPGQESDGLAGKVTVCFHIVGEGGWNRIYRNWRCRYICDTRDQFTDDRLLCNRDSEMILFAGTYK